MRVSLHLLLSAIFLLPHAAAAQDTLWSRTFGGIRPDECYSIAPSAGGGCALAGMTSSFGANFLADAWLVFTDENGDSVASRRYGGTGEDWWYDLERTPDGGYALAGYTTSFGMGNADFWLLKANSAGDSLWSRTYGGTYFDMCFDLVPHSDGGFLLAGRSSSFGAGNAGFWIVRTNESGDSLWSRSYGTPYSDECHAACATFDSGYALTGCISASAAGNRDVWLVKTDMNGDSLWSRSFGGNLHDDAYAIQEIPDGGFVLAGYTYSYGSGDADAWLIRTDDGGNALWTRTFGGPGTDWFNDVRQTPDGGFLAAGQTSSYGAGGADFWVAKIAENGDSLWSATFGGPQSDECYALSLLDSSRFLLAGRTSSFGNAAGDFWLMKMEIAASASDRLLSPSSFLLSAYPNPFNATTVITYAVPTPSQVSLSLHDITGRRVQTMVDAFYPSGSYRYRLNAISLPSGLYFCHLTAAHHSTIRKIILLK